MSSQSPPPTEKNQEADSTRLLLDAIESGERLTQRGLASELGIALGLINIYLKRCISKGLVKVRKAPARRYAYYLTAKGFSEKARLTAKFLSRSLSFFRLAREDYTGLFAARRAKGLQRVAFIGAGELCEVAILAAMDSGIEISAIFDEETNRRQLAGIPVVRSLSELAFADALVITDMKDPQGAYDRMARHFGMDRVLFPNLLRLTRQPHLPVAAK